MGGITYSLSAGVATVTIDRPPVNALSAETYMALDEALHHVKRDPDVRVVILTGAGTRAFCAGTDMAAFSNPELAATTSENAVRFFENLASYSLPIVGALNGPAVGGGVMIAAECDVIVATSSAYFEIPEIQIGLAGGASHARQIFPETVVKRMALLGQRVSAAEAERYGVLEVVSTEGLLVRAHEIAEHIAALRADAVRLSLSTLRNCGKDTIWEYRTELATVSTLLRSGVPQLENQKEK